MDVQMPEMGGLEATRAIRAWEAEGPGRGRVPIVAMTAHAMKGDRENCLAAGMDGYVAKPIQARQLLDALRAALRPSPFDPAELLQRVEGDRDLLREMIGLFHDCEPRLLSQLRTAVAGGQAQGVRRAAHAFRGAVGNFAAGAVLRAIERLEALATDGALAGADEALGELEEEAGRLRAALDRWLAEGEAVDRRP
jgi:CheY-like chemotaxis protein